MKRLVPISLMGFALLLLFTGCRTSKPKYAPLSHAALNAPKMETVTNTLDPAWLRPPGEPFTLGPGDRLEIELLDDPMTKVATVVGPDGKVYFNLLPGLDVWGMTLPQTKAALEQELSKFIRGTPQVNLTLRAVESKRVWLLGRVQAPGVYPMPTPMTVLEAVSMAGGTASFSGSKQQTSGQLAEDLADLKRSFIVRQGKLLPVNFYRLLNEGDISQNIYLQPDDFVYFSPAYTKQVYVLGAVVQPQPVAFHDGITLAGAVAGAYGTLRDAYIYNVVIVRGALAQPQAALVDYNAIVHGRANDIALQPGDIVYVPFSPYRYLKKYIEIALNVFVSSVAINAGSSVLGGGDNGAAGVFIPVGSNIQITPPPAPPVGR